MKSPCIFMLRYQKIIILPCRALTFSCCAFKKLSLVHEECSHFPVAVLKLSLFHKQCTHIPVVLSKNYHCFMKSARIFLLHYQKIIVLWRVPAFSGYAIKIIIILWRAFAFSYQKIVKIIIVPLRALSFSCCAIKKISLFHEEHSHFPVTLSKLSSFHEQCAHFPVALSTNYHGSK